MECLVATRHPDTSADGLRTAILPGSISVKHVALNGLGVCASRRMSNRIQDHRENGTACTAWLINSKTGEEDEDEDEEEGGTASTSSWLIVGPQSHQRLSSPYSPIPHTPQHSTHCYHSNPRPPFPPHRSSNLIQLQSITNRSTHPYPFRSKGRGSTTTTFKESREWMG